MLEPPFSRAWTDLGRVVFAGQAPATGKPMHIPDGFLSTPVAIVLWIISAAAVGYALWRANRELTDRAVPMMGVLAAAIFAGQMLNFSVAGGTSGHLLGATLAVILVGPWSAVIVMTSVVSIQALVFQDGGLLALGANLFNMAIVGVFVAWGVYQLVRRLLASERPQLLVGGAAAAWLSIIAAALACALELALSGTSPANVGVPAMGLIHMLIGLGEALITVSALRLVMAARPDLVRPSARSAPAGVWIAGLAMALSLAVLSPLASSSPDGLERVAENLGFLEKAREAAFHIIPDYVFPGVADEKAATIVAGLLGTLLVFGVALGVSRLARRRRAAGEQSAQP